MVALEDLDETDTESKINVAAEKMELKGSGWGSDRVSSMASAFCIGVTKGGSSTVVELPTKFLSILNKDHKSDINCGSLCISAR